jgi:uncharacterized membrane protein YedE/YeeE
MKLGLAALVLGVVTGFTFAWARMTDPRTFHAMLSLDSPRIYLLMGSAVAVAFIGARVLRGRRALLTGEPINWTATRPTRSHVLGSVLFGIGWGIAGACPGPTAAALVGVKVQPALARATKRVSEGAESPIPVVQGADVL